MEKSPTLTRPTFSVALFFANRGQAKVKFRFHWSKTHPLFFFKLDSENNPKLAARRRRAGRKTRHEQLLWALRSALDSDGKKAYFVTARALNLQLEDPNSRIL
ncbi:hypothetical protein GN958_ATG01832 [Phytophthora infestans]|uniref:Uncharacterized protein n=1 Tax=Phytophthora infestans TaxID=4787 RepID=A0A8S9VEL2_PHYIN|nr:hypothetical protein GN958_ATG01832 [Phytophthora infestans]